MHRCDTLLGMAEQTVVLTFRVPEWMAERVRQMARAEQRTMANLLRILLERALAAQETRHE